MTSTGHVCLLAAALLTLASTANASNRWEEAGSGAVAILPLPLKSASVTGGSLHCAEQRWSLGLRTEGLSGKAGTGRTGIDIDGIWFDAPPEISRDYASLPVPHEALELLKGGNRLGVSLTGGDDHDAFFSLSGSRAVLDAIAPRCGQVDMSAFTAVVLKTDDPIVVEATPLLADLAREHREWSGKQPAYAAAVLELAPGRKLMFASICGSTGFFGASGCSLNGYASEGADAGWRLVYETEGVLMHTDPSAGTENWPDLVTLPAVNGAEPTRWTWSGSRYELRELVAEQATLAEQGDASAR